VVRRVEAVQLSRGRLEAGRRIGAFGKSDSPCKLCSGFPYHAPKVSRKLSFVDLDLLLSQRKVTFCTSCISEVVLCMSSTVAARAKLLTSKSHHSNMKRVLNGQHVVQHAVQHVESLHVNPVGS
jgi:hypothetical protein